jgi:hypothetical protein
MSDFNTVEVRENSIVIKDSPQWMIVTDEVKITLYQGESQIVGKSCGKSDWFLWVDNETTEEVERAAKNHDSIAVNVNQH